VEEWLQDPTIPHLSKHAKEAERFDPTDVRHYLFGNRSRPAKAPEAAALAQWTCLNCTFLNAAGCLASRAIWREMT
jgi:hypothetical protein